MIAYLLKSTVCLLLLLVAYHLFLEREKMHRFNRFFLLFALVFSLAIPLFTINIGSSVQLSQQIDELNSRLTAQPPATMQYAPQTTPETQPTESKVSYFESAVPWLLLFYIIISSVMALRLIRNLYLLWSKIRSNPHVSFGPSTLVLVDDGSVPHSFFRYIFVDRQLYQSRNIDEAVLAHEQAHSRQFHSLDILFIELLKIAFWFNPMLYFYKKAIQTNHEFLADEAVIADSSNVQSYQKLLLKMQSRDPELQLASSIKYSITKKRIIMMTKTTPRFRMICKQLALVPILASLVFAFSIRTVSAQNVDQMSLTELIDAVNQRLESTESLSSEEQEKLQTLMTKMQEKFMPDPPPPPKPRISAKPPAPKSTQQIYEFPVPPKASKTDHKKVGEAAQKYHEAIKNYMDILPAKENEEKLKTAYEKIEVLRNKYSDLYMEISKKYENNPPPAPPLPSPPKPEMRIKAHSSKNPPPKPKVPAHPQKIKAQNLLNIVIDSAGQIEVEGEPTPVDQIKTKMKEFLENHRNNLKSSGSPKRAAIAIKTSEETPQNTIEAIVNVTNQAYNEVRNEAAQAEFGANYLELDKSKKAKIRQIYPNDIIVREGNSSPPAPIPSAKVDTTDLKQLSKNYNKLIEKYLAYEPVMENKAAMEDLNNKISSLYDEWETIKDKNGIKLPPPPQAAAIRINNYYRNHPEIAKSYSIDSQP